MAALVSTVSATGTVMAGIQKKQEGYKQNALDKRRKMIRSLLPKTQQPKEEKMETEPEMTDKELINYCDRHCKTPRAMFSISQVRRMIKLSGVDAEVQDYVKWMSLKEEMQDMVDKARENLLRGKI